MKQLMKLGLCLCLCLTACGSKEDSTPQPGAEPGKVPHVSPTPGFENLNIDLKAKLEPGLKGGYQVRLSWTSDASPKSFGIIRHQERPATHLLLTVNLVDAVYVDTDARSGMNYKYELIVLSPTSGGYMSVGDAQVSIPQ